MGSGQGGISEGILPSRVQGCSSTSAVMGRSQSPQVTIGLANSGQDKAWLWSSMHSLSGPLRVDVYLFIFLGG